MLLGLGMSTNSHITWSHPTSSVGQWPSCIIGSHDYYHAPLGFSSLNVLPMAQWPSCIKWSRDYYHTLWRFSSFSFSIQNVWEKSTMVNKIACHLCTACPPAIVLSQILQALPLYIANMLKCFICSKNKLYYHDCETITRLTKNQLSRFSFDK